jgi:hypothetical protein
MRADRRTQDRGIAPIMVRRENGWLVCMKSLRTCHANNTSGGASLLLAKSASRVPPSQ